MFHILLALFLITLSACATQATIALGLETYRDVLPDWHHVDEVGKMMALFIVTIVALLSVVSVCLWALTCVVIF